MENRLNKKVEQYLTEFKESIKVKLVSSNIDTHKINDIIAEVLDYPRLTFEKEDFSKRKRSKNVVPYHERCCAKRANGEQCTRRKRGLSQFCGTHSKGSPHGSFENVNDVNKNDNKKIEVFTKDIKGIIYYLDNSDNVYDASDVISNKLNPRIIAKYTKQIDNDGSYVYSIPEYNI